MQKQNWKVRIGLASAEGGAPGALAAPCVVAVLVAVLVLLLPLLVVLLLLVLLVLLQGQRTSGLPHTDTAEWSSLFSFFAAAAR
eukprot:COSAG02_NODE_5157_length_4582_cov_29.351996_1_plen_84_part_00